MADGTHGTGPNNSGSGSGNPSDASSVDIERLINDAVSKALGARMKRLNVEEQINAAVQKALSAVTPAPAQADPAEVPNHGDTEQRLNLKTVNSQIKAMQEELAAERRARQEADSRATQMKMRTDLQGAFSKYAGSDNPHLPAYLNHYADKFRVHEGATYQIGKDDFGNEELVPLDMAVDHLFKNELKHLVPKNTPNLPPTSIIRGMPMPGQQPQNGQARTGFLEQEIMHAQAMTDPTVFNELYGGKKPG
jgi:hypothetical protein